jgi:hypothetical protein
MICEWIILIVIWAGTKLHDRLTHDLAAVAQGAPKLCGELSWVIFGSQVMKTRRRAGLALAALGAVERGAGDFFFLRELQGGRPRKRDKDC